MDNTYNFKLPIYYVESKNKLDDSIVDDLELVKSKDISGEALYDNLIKSDNFIGDKTIPMWSEFYSYDKVFLQNTQSLITNFKDFNCDNECLKNTLENWEMIQTDDVFIDRYQYIDLPYVRKYNTSTTVLHMYSLYNLSSPAISLISPIFGLIVPFFILKLQGIPITFEKYQNVLIEMIKNSTIGKLFTDFSGHRWDKQLSLLVSAGLYIFGLYQNIIACYKFYININKICMKKLLKECLKALKKPEVQNKVKEFMKPYIELILNEMYPYIYLSLLFVLISFFLILGIFLLLLRINYKTM